VRKKEGRDVQPLALDMDSTRDGYCARRASNSSLVRASGEGAPPPMVYTRVKRVDGPGAAGCEQRWKESQWGRSYALCDARAAAATIGARPVRVAKTGRDVKIAIAIARPGFVALRIVVRRVDEGVWSGVRVCVRMCEVTLVGGG